MSEGKVECKWWHFFFKNEWDQCQKCYEQRMKLWYHRQDKYIQRRLELEEFCRQNAPYITLDTRRR